MLFDRLVAGSLARRFALSAAALAAVALMLTLIASAALVTRQHATGLQELQKKEMDFHAASVRGSLQSLATRLGEVAESAILANALVDSAGRETYLKPYLNGARQVNGVPVQLTLTDFEGNAITSSTGAAFSAAQLAWLRRQLEQASDAATVMDAPDGPELLAVRLLRYSRTSTPEGALLYKVRLADIDRDNAIQLVSGAQPAASTAELRRISVPPAYGKLDLQLLRSHAAPVDYSALLPHYALILVVVLALAAAVLWLGSRLALALTHDLRRLEGFSSSVVRDGLGLRRAEVRGSREVASLAYSINHMLDRLHRQQAQLQNEKQAVRESGERLREALLAANMAAWSWDLDSGQAHFSDNAQAVFGAGWRAAAHDWSFLPAADRSRLRSMAEDALARHASFRCEVELPGADGAAPRWVEVRGKADSRVDAPRTSSGIVLDISERKRAEVALLLADQRKDEFLAMLAHELRNPLAPISSAVKIIELLLPDASSQVKKARDVIERQTRHLSRLVDDLMDVSRISTGKIVLRDEEVDAAAMIMRAIEMNRPLLEARGHQLRTQGLSQPQMLRGDSTRLTQIVGNLVNNAAKYTEAGGLITVTLAREHARLVIRVADNGVGMSPQIVPHVFNLFLQAERSLDRSLGGLGIGLSVVRQLTELHGGTVEAHSAGERMGSEFVVRLPLQPDAGLPARLAPAARRILVVDDNRDAVDALAMMLALSGSDVEVAYDGLSALAIAQSFRPDAVVLDIGLPGMDGYEVATRLRARPESAATLIIAVTGYGQKEDRERARAAGFDHHLLKPIDSETLLKLLSGP